MTTERLFKPILAGARLMPRLLAVIGATAGIGLTIVLCLQFPIAYADLPIIVAPIGASAVLVFAVPTSPLAQPWSVVGGNILSALVGVAAARWIPPMALAAGVAVGGAILVMSLCRCLHPPGGAAALTAVIGSQGIHDAGYAFAFAPVGLNSIALVSLAMFFHRMTGHSYPHQPAAPAIQSAQMREASGLHSEDIDKALEDMDESFDISRDDLALLLSQAELHALARRTTGQK
ncbi:MULTISPECIES: HPP family protein [unclassified Sphingobium]|uniref:HPP family protein n=1 Tax=unclassified Sphingobium TaxID=2611147 RepID=UPI002224137D|nr:MULTISPECIES: HPP family protein [unclassified Sphingobium]MCW2381613.1 CBS domain-containing membrane protein [Sphingobium sp. B2D3B]MCW2398280.1 CBS domain-containing membrane protein [Sphingobium sp. B2D3C]